MLKILYDHQMFSEQVYGGISRYFKYIIDGITQAENITYKLGILRSENYYIQDEYQPLKSPIFNPLFKTPQKLNKWNKSYCKYLVKKNDFSILHPTYFNPYLLQNLKKPLVLTVHDMTYEALPQFFPSSDPLPHYKRLLMEKASKIIAISETTKADILKYSNIKENKIEVILHGTDFKHVKNVNIPNLPKQYILFVGARWSYKNFHLAAQAFKNLSYKDPDLRFVLAGGGKLDYGDSEFLLRNGILDKTIQISASDGELNTLYKNAICLIFPSLYEGFGFPILEAFKNNCPLILSDCSCFFEIAGDAALYFEHKSLESIIEQVEKIIDNPILRQAMISRGKVKLLDYPIEKCVSKTIDLYKSI